ncbi:MAG: SDR family NAD(P)-dependent oxidoreductase [Parasphingorhabdus sp.]
MTWRMQGKTAVITGGASGLGLEFARRYIEAGMHVALADRNRDSLNAAEQELTALADADVHIMAEQCDVSDADQMQEFCDAVYTKFDAVHCLMNNAGMGLPVGAPWESRDALQETMAINLGGVINGCHSFIPKMLEGGQSASRIAMAPGI